MSLKIEIVLKSCSDCRYKDHSGAFTPGGARSICGHPYAPECVMNYKQLDDEKKWYWEYRVLPSKGIPGWCPLKNGYSY